MTPDIITVRFVSGTHQTNTVRGQRASSTSSYLQAAQALCLKLYPNGATEPRHLPGRSSAGVEVFEVVPPAVSQVIWINEDVVKPDAEMTVLVELVDDSEPVWLGFWSGETWLDACTGGPFAGRVVAWAELPKGGTQ